MAQQQEPDPGHDGAGSSLRELETRFQSMPLSVLLSKVQTMMDQMSAEVYEYGSPNDDDVDVALVEFPVAMSVLVRRQRPERNRVAEAEARESERAEALRQQQIEAHIQSLPLSRLEWFVLTKQAHWEFAKRVLRQRRATGADIGHKPPQPPIPDRAVPHNPEGTEGDYWRIKGG